MFGTGKKRKRVKIKVDIVSGGKSETLSMRDNGIIAEKKKAKGK